ncbi:L-lactate dehydrogenase [Rhizobium sp. NPDC090275]|uniref:L-lactate dehydrogenase n=1 Tax=Rhizobium sp. NPDC090275 TaxID=3364498 RepID=UPI00383A3410
MRKSSRVAIIGSGNVGATTAYALMLRGLFSEIVLIDAKRDHAVAEATDIADANPVAKPVRIWAGDYKDAAQASIMVITAGAATHGEETRLSVAEKSAAIVRSCISDAMAAGFDGMLVVASNPTDAMTQVAQAASGLPHSRVIGSGTLLDSNRFRKRIADHLSIAPGAVEGMVFGEHGDSEVVAYSTVRVGGVPLEKYAEAASIDREAIAHDVVRAGYTINHGKGYTSFGVATAIARICEAIERDERVVLPVSSYIDGICGVSGVYLSLPCLIGSGGVERVITPDLMPEELSALQASANVLKETLSKINLR